VRGKGGAEVQLQTYQDFQDPRLFDQAVFTEGIKKVSRRDYEKGVSKIFFDNKSDRVIKLFNRRRYAQSETLEELRSAKPLRSLSLQRWAIALKRCRN